MAQAGRVEEALPLLELAVDVAMSKGLLGASALWIARLGTAMLLAGRADEARVLCGRALDAARRYRARGHEAWALYLLGEVTGAGEGPVGADSPAVGAAAAHYGAAMATATPLGMRPLVARCHVKLGGLCRRVGRRDEAGLHLGEAAVMFREMGMRPVADDAQVAPRQDPDRA